MRVTLAWLALALVLLGSLTGVGYARYGPMYARDLPLAKRAGSELRTAVGDLRALQRNPFDAEALAAARDNFGRLLADTGTLRGDLDALPPGVAAIPHYGALIVSAHHLLPLAGEIAQAGLLGCDAWGRVASALRSPLATAGQGLTRADLAAVDRDVAGLAALYPVVAAQVNGLRPSDLALDPRLGQAVAQFRAGAPAIAQGIDGLRTALPALPALLGVDAPASYLLEQMDSTELRPGGGFVGAYGVLAVTGGRLAGAHVTDTYVLDHAYANAGGSIPLPRAYSWFPLAPTWGLRDSNLEADFPTDARTAERIYRTEGGSPAVQGVVAITPWLIVDVLKIIGSIDVTEYHETITAANVIDRIHFHQLAELAGQDYVPPDPRDPTSIRKRFTSYLFEHFLARVRALAAKDGPRLAVLVGSALRSKDIQIYVDDPRAEALLARWDLASSVAAPPGGDSLFVVDANIVGSKSNGFMTYSMRDDVTLAESGAATHRLTLTYAWPVTAEATANDYGSTYLYRDYLRIYLPPGSVLGSQTGWDAAGQGSAFGRTVFAGYVSFTYGQTWTVALTWTVPHAATRVGAAWRYQFLIQKQAGLTWQRATMVGLPACATPVGTATGLVVAGGKATAARAPLSEDRTLSIMYRC